MIVPNDKIERTLHSFILEEFLAGEEADQLTDSTPLMTSGILDSIATLKLVSFVEKTFGIEVAAHEADAEHLNTLSDIAALVRSKQAN
jgi:acyl carrier protein